MSLLALTGVGGVVAMAAAFIPTIMVSQTRIHGRRLIALGVVIMNLVAISAALQEVDAAVGLWAVSLGGAIFLKRTVKREDHDAEIAQVAKALGRAQG